MPPTPIFFLRKNNFLATNFERDKYKNCVENGEKGVCILGTGSHQYSPSF
jgi:hypothetical protein